MMPSPQKTRTIASIFGKTLPRSASKCLSRYYRFPPEIQLFQMKSITAHQINKELCLPVDARAAPKPYQPFVMLCARTTDLVPIFALARKPETNSPPFHNAVRIFLNEEPDRPSSFSLEGSSHPRRARETSDVGSPHSDFQQI